VPGRRSSVSVVTEVCSIRGVSPGRGAAATLRPMTVEALRSAVEAAVERSDVGAAWAAIEPHREAAKSDPELAILFLSLIHATPDRPGGDETAVALGTAHAAEPSVVAMAVRSLIGIAELRVQDEPKLEAEGPAEHAADLAKAALVALSDAERANKDVGGWLRSLHANALRLCGPARDEEAQAAFEVALDADRGDGGLWFDLALLHKWRGRWKPAYDCNLRAQARLGDTKPVLFNLGISATAANDGNVAGLCWKKLGFTPTLNEKSGHAFVDGLPPMQVRVLSRGSGYGFPGAIPDQAVSFEVVWVQPLSPCHGVVVTPTFRDAPIDYGDVVLWDAAPVTVVAGPDGPVPRFPLLEILRRGDERRIRFVALEQKRGDAEALASSLPDGCKVVVQEERVEHICPICASGDSMKKHDHLPPEEHRIVYGKLLAPGEVAPPELRAALDAAIRSSGTVSMAIPGLYELLGDAKRAGQEHQAWRGIERAAIKQGLVGDGARTGGA